jgi:Na+-transporting NADH:ubiquinone oxidoreductase subunit C
MGLWGPIYGYLAINDDKNTVFGAYFNHDSETAGLGAEIKDSRAWQNKFQGKKIFKEGSEDIALSVKKKVEDPATQVDAVTGATLTSDGVSLMIQEGLKPYVKFLTNK